MAKSNTTFSKDKQPTKRRGKAQRTMLIEALKEAGHTEEGFYRVMLERALNPEDQASSQLMKEVLARLYPASKPTLPIVEFELNGETPIDRVRQIEKAISDGSIPADVAKIMVDIIKSSIEIEKITELAERIENIERMLNESGDTE